jgi:hypothetical protein
MGHRFTSALFFFFFVATLHLFPQETQPKYLEFFPSGVHFLPLRANMAEAKVGVLYMTDNMNLKVDIGNTIDLLKFRKEDSSVVTVGLDFMAYANANSYSGYRLQISALDGFFGGNAVYSFKHNGAEYFLRGRYLHNSAHRVDGFFDVNLGQWIDGQSQTPFTRDYGELTGAVNFSSGDFFFRPYLAVSYAVRVRPKLLKRFMGYTGLEVHSREKLLSPGLPYSYFTAFQAQLSGRPAYQLSYHTQAGVKFGKWDEKGLSLYASYFYGPDYFNEFYYLRIEKFSIGFFVDF